MNPGYRSSIFLPIANYAVHYLISPLFHAPFIFFSIVRTMKICSILKNDFNQPGSLLMSRLSCLFSSYVMGLAVSTSSSLSTSNVFFLAAILETKQTWEHQWSTLRRMINLFSFTNYREACRYMQCIQCAYCRLWTSKGATMQLVVNKVQPKSAKTYLLFADLLDADCFLGCFSAFGWACEACAFAADFCLAWLFGCAGAACLVSFLGFFSGFFLGLFATITVSPVSLLSCSCTEISCGEEKQYLWLHVWLDCKMLQSQVSNRPTHLFTGQFYWIVSLKVSNKWRV